MGTLRSWRLPLTFDADAVDTLVDREIENWDISATSSSPSMSAISRSWLLDVVVRNDSKSSSPTPSAISASSCASSSSRFFYEIDQ